MKTNFVRMIMFETAKQVLDPRRILPQLAIMLVGFGSPVEMAILNSPDNSAPIDWHSMWASPLTWSGLAIGAIAYLVASSRSLFPMVLTLFVSIVLAILDLASVADVGAAACGLVGMSLIAAVPFSIFGRA